MSNNISLEGGILSSDELCVLLGDTKQGSNLKAEQSKIFLLHSNAGFIVNQRMSSLLLTERNMQCLLFILIFKVTHQFLYSYNHFYLLHPTLLVTFIFIPAPLASSRSLPSFPAVDQGLNEENIALSFLDLHHRLDLRTEL